MRLHIVSGSAGLSDKCRFRFETFRPAIACESRFLGGTEKQAAEQGIGYSVGRFQFAASGKAMAAGERDGFVKLIFDGEKRIIGAHMIGANVTEMLGEPTLAKTLGATAYDIAHTIHSHPTMNEGIMEAAEQALGCAIHA